MEGINALKTERYGVVSHAARVPCGTLGVRPAFLVRWQGLVKTRARPSIVRGKNLSTVPGNNFQGVQSNS